MTNELNEAEKAAKEHLKMSSVITPTKSMELWLEAFFVAGWHARDEYEKKQLAESLAFFDNDDNDCGDSCKI